MNYRYELEKYKTPASRIKCPQCGKRQLVPFVDTYTGERLPEEYGKCNRADRCGYFLSPYHDGYSSREGKGGGRIYIPEPEIINPNYHDFELFRQSLRGYDINDFCQFILSKFGVEKLQEVVNRYQIGTTKSGNVIFWQIDREHRIHAGKIMAYNRLTGRRGKDNITWVHTRLKLVDFVLQQCFFGEHLISDKPIGVVESEKTACICSLMDDRLTWLASGGKNISEYKLKTLIGRNVTLFPDSGMADQWAKFGFPVSYIIEAQEVGYDLADYFLDNLK